MIGDREELLKVIRSKYKTELDTARANLSIMVSRPTSIPEHSDWITEADKWIAQMAEATDKIAVINAELGSMSTDQKELDF